MRREYPATPDEAFEQALEGAYFAQELFAAAKQGRIGGFPYDPRSTVQTFWDLGRNDLNTIWLHQHVNGFDRFVGYYENSGEFIGHYVAWLKEWARERDATFGDHYIPHDGDRESLWLESGTKGVMGGLGFRPRIVERPRNKLEAIAAAALRLPALPVRRALMHLGPEAASRLSQGVGRAARGVEGPAPPRRSLARRRRVPDLRLQRIPTSGDAKPLQPQARIRLTRLDDVGPDTIG